MNFGGTHAQASTVASNDLPYIDKAMHAYVFQAYDAAWGSLGPRVYYGELTQACIWTHAPFRIADSEKL